MKQGYKATRNTGFTNSGSGNFSTGLVFMLVLFFALKTEAENCTVNANVDQTICANTTLTLVGQASGLFPGGTAVVTWSQLSGPSAVITSPNSLTTTVTSLIGGNVYKFRLSSPCEDGSIATDDVTVTVTQTPVANAGADFGPTCNASPAGTLAGNSISAGETGQWSIVAGGPTGVTFNGSSTIPNARFNFTNAATSGNVTFRWTKTVTASGCTAFDDVIVPKPGGSTTVTASAPNPTACYMSTTSVTLAGSYAGNGTGGQGGIWTVVNGPNIPTITTPSSATSTVTNLIAGTYTLKWTVTGPCANGSALATFTVPPPVGAPTTATASIQGNPVMAICDGRSSFVLLGNTTLLAGETIAWSKTVGGNATIVSPTSSMTEINGLDGVGPYTFRFTVSNVATGCSTSATTSISYGAPPSISISTANPAILSCGSSTAIITYTQAGTGALQYSILSGPVTATYPVIPTAYTNAPASPASLTGFTVPGTYVIRFKKPEGTGSSCTSAFQDITVIVSKSPTGSNSGSSQVLACNIVQTQLAGNIPATGTGKWTQVSGPNAATFANTSLFNTNITSLVSGTYTFRWLISAGPACSTQQSDVTVKVATAQPNPSNAGPDQLNVCFGTPLSLLGSTPLLNETGTWTVTPSSGITFSDTHSRTAIVNGLVASTTYTFTWTITNGCGSSADACIISTTSAQGPVASNAGIDQCKASGTTSITFAGNNPSPGTGEWTKIAGGAATITTPGSATSTVSGLSNGTYQFKWTITYGSCAVSTDTVMVTISAAATTANAGTDQNVCGTSVTLAANTPSVGTGSWLQVSGGGGITISSPSSGNSTVTGLADGVYTFRWAVANNACAGNTDDVQINVTTPATSANAGPDQIKCGTTSATMAANTITNGSGYWSLVSGPNTPVITAPALPTTTVTGLTTGLYTFSWNSYSGPFCSTSTDEMTIQVVPAANAGSNQTPCAATSINLSGNVSTTGTWTQQGSSPNTAIITNTSSSTATASGLIPGLYTFNYSISVAGCTASNASMTVTVSAMPTAANAGPDQNICNATSWTMNANTPIIGTGSWTKMLGSNNPTFTPTTSPTAAVTNGTAQSYLYEWRITNGSCISSDQVYININNIALSSDAGPDQSHVCGTDATLAAAVPSAGLGTWSQVSGPNSATISSLITNNTTLTGLISGAYVFRWTVTSGICPSVLDEVTITDFTNPTTANAGADQNLCNATSATLAGNTISTGTGLWSLISGPTGSTFSAASSPTSTLNNMAAGTYVLQWTSTLGTCTSSDQVTIINYAAPTSSTAAASINNCQFSTLNLAGNTPASGSGTWTQLAGDPLIISSPTSPTTQIIGANVGSYTFRWTISNGTCPSSISDEVVTVNAIPTMALAGVDQVKTCTPLTGTFQGNSPTVGTGTWTQVSGPNTATISNSHLYNTGLSGLAAGSYVFKWEIANGTCTSSDNMQYAVNVKTADLSITKTDGSATYTSGTNTVYSVVVQNAGPDNSIGTVITDNAVPGTSIASWTAHFTGGATGTTSGTGNISRTVNIPAGGSATYTVTLAVPCSYAGNLANTATVANACDIDPDSSNNSATDTDSEATPVALNVWNGSISENWNDPRNWNLNSVPTCSPAVIASIPAGLSVYPVISTNGMNTAKLVIQNGATLTINPGKDLTVCGCTEINGACGLSLKSDETNGNASFLSGQSGSVTYPNNGTACVDVYIKSCVTGIGCWHYVSTPVSAVNIGTVFAGDYVQKYNEVLGQWSGYISNGQTPMLPEEGYIVNNPGDGIRTFTGHLNEGTITLPLTRTVGKGGGWNLVGNPYPNEIDLNTQLDWTNIDQVVYFYDQQAGNYFVYPAAVGFGTGSRYVPSMQGFFVHVNSGYTSGNLKFTNANRTTSGEVTFYKSDPVTKDVLNLKVQGKGTLNDKAIVYFSKDVSTNFDKDRDCIKFAGITDAPQLYTLATDNTKLSINALPYSDIETTVPLNFNVSTNGAGNYTLTASNIESFRTGSIITLEDLKTSRTIDLMANPEYTFGFSAGDDPARFRLHFTNTTVGLIDQQSAKELEIYAIGHELFIKNLNTNPTAGEFIVCNMMGQEITRNKVCAQTLNKYRISCAKGYYIIRVITKDKTHNSKIYFN